jgi:hypothetical protein
MISYVSILSCRVRWWDIEGLCFWSRQWQAVSCNWRYALALFAYVSVVCRARRLLWVAMASFPLSSHHHHYRHHNNSNNNNNNNLHGSVLSARDIYLVKQSKASPLLMNPKAHTVHLSTHSAPLCGTSCMQHPHLTVIIVIDTAVVYGSLLLEHIVTSSINLAFQQIKARISVPAEQSPLLNCYFGHCMSFESIKNVTMRKLFTVLSTVEQDTKPTVLGPPAELLANSNFLLCQYKFEYIIYSFCYLHTFSYVWWCVFSLLYFTYNAV